MLFQDAKDSKSRSGVVLKALAGKLARALGISFSEVESNKVLTDYGVDSLMAVELGEWIGKYFQATVAVYEIMSGTPLYAIGDLVVDRSNLGK